MRQLLSDAVDDFMALRSSNDYAKGTLVNDRGVLKRFLTINGNIFINDVTDRHVTRHFEQASKTRSPSSLTLDHTTLKMFFDWARRTRRLPMDRDPMVGRRPPKKRKRERDRVHVSQFSNLLDIAGMSDARNRAMFAIFLYTLIRDQEAAAIRVGDLDLNGGWLEVTITKTYTSDRMPICEELDSEMRLWLPQYAANIGRPLDPRDFLLPRRQIVNRNQDPGTGRFTSFDTKYMGHKPIGRPGKVVKDVLREAGFAVENPDGSAKYEGSHTLRRSGARALFDRLSERSYDNALRIVQSMLHHSSTAQTEHYLGLTPDRWSRDEIIRGKRLYPVDQTNVVRLTV